MPSVGDQHHHRSNTKLSHKPFKSRFASKNARKDRAKGNIENSKVGLRKTRLQEVMSKFDRKNQAKQKRNSKHQDHLQTSSIFAGRDGAPRIVAVIPLCNDISGRVASMSLNKSLDIDEDVLEEGTSHTHIDRFKQKLQYVNVRKNLLAAMDACKLADYVLFVLSATEEVDDEGEAMLKCIEGQGVSNVYTAVLNMDRIPSKRRNQVLVSLKSFITHFFPSQEKVFAMDSPQECQNLLRSLCTTTPKGIQWRENRAWMLTEEVRWISNPAGGVNEDRTTAIITGIVRGRHLQANRLLQVGDWGDFQIEKIEAATSTPRQKDGISTIAMESDVSNVILDQPDADQETLDELAPEEATMPDVENLNSTFVASDRKGVLLDDHHYFSDAEREESSQRPRRVPKGTSNYQSAWYLGDVSDSGSDMEEIDHTSVDFSTRNTTSYFDPFCGTPAPAPIHATEATASDYPQSEGILDVLPEETAEAREFADYRAQKKKSDADEDAAFPDEIELQPHVLVRERLARYRGLNSSRTSPWITEEDAPYQPRDWDRLLEIKDYKVARNNVLRETLTGGVKPGTMVHIHLRDVPLALLRTYTPTQPLGAFSLLRHEHKRTAVDFSFTLTSQHPSPLKSKDELLVQAGPRRFVVSPIFSQGGETPNHVFKFERYLHPGQTVVASFVAPLTWGSVPVLYFEQRADADPNEGPGNEEKSGMDLDGASQQITRQSIKLIGHGTILPSTPSRIIAKRLVLTGQPYKIHKRLVTIRYMFFNKEDVEWFKALRLFTNRGKQGTFKESLGTHGYFKAVFEGGVGMMDSVGVALWKRVWPRSSRSWTPKNPEEVQG